MTDTDREELLKAAREEVVRRQEAQLAARKLIEEADRHYAHAEYQVAAKKYETALATLPFAAATAADRSAAQNGITRSYYRLSEIALAEENYSKALDYANRALETNPDSRTALAMVAKAERFQRVAKEREGAPPPPDPSKTEEFLDS
ncbi:MAG: tetratricopeptide repeat protein, partial [Planctomycetales bacterium]|nr:tetratricopeptide repeat protein [Planctomycetales bacterium]NIP67690.1 tetratricopeptide repeat protein [Planctomycetales bacterium]